MKITQEKINLIEDLGITLNEAAFLYSLRFGEFTMEISPVRVKKLEVLGYLLEGILTPKGEDTAALLTDTEIVVPYLKEEFETFWVLYPADDGSDLHVPTRKLKGNKKEAYEEYAKVRTESSQEEILKGLTNEINFRRGIPDRFKYMKNIVNWLKNKVFLNYWEDTEYKDIYGKEII